VLGAIADWQCLWWLRFGGAPRTGEGGTGLDRKPFFCTALEKRKWGEPSKTNPKGLSRL
jgi:hypothetical protein